MSPRCAKAYASMISTTCRPCRGCGYVLYGDRACHICRQIKRATSGLRVEKPKAAK